MLDYPNMGRETQLKSSVSPRDVLPGTWSVYIRRQGTRYRPVSTPVSGLDTQSSGLKIEVGTIINRHTGVRAVT